MIYLVVHEDYEGSSIFYTSTDEQDAMAYMKNEHEARGYMFDLVLQAWSGAEKEFEKQAEDLFGEAPQPVIVRQMSYGPHMKDSLAFMDSMLKAFYAPAIIRDLEEPTSFLGLLSQIKQV